MEIKVFEPKFNQAVIDLILNIQQKEFSIPISLAEQPDLLDIENSYQNQGGQFWVAVDDEKEVLGCIGLVALRENNVALKKMFVAATHRKAEECDFSWNNIRICSGSIFLPESRI